MEDPRREKTEGSRYGLTYDWGGPFDWFEHSCTSVTMSIYLAKLRDRLSVVADAAPAKVDAGRIGFRLKMAEVPFGLLGTVIHLLAGTKSTPPRKCPVSPRAGLAA